MIKVIGHDSLARDSSSAIVNTNVAEFESFMNQYKERIAITNRIKYLEEKADLQDKKLDSILELLKGMTNGNS